MVVLSAGLTNILLIRAGRMLPEEKVINSL